VGRKGVKPALREVAGVISYEQRIAGLVKRLQIARNSASFLSFRITIIVCFMFIMRV
jgi:hypothetical protein